MTKIPFHAAQDEMDKGILMNVADIMTVKPFTIHRDKPLRHALELMQTHGFRHLPVINSERQLVGILSDRDCRMALNSPYIPLRRSHSDDLSDQLQVRLLMTPAPITIEPDRTVEEAVRLMLDHHIGCLPVLVGETLVGIITRSDVMVAFLQMMRAEMQEGGNRFN